MSYKAPLASSANFGIISIGSGLSITNGVARTNLAYGYFSDSTTQSNPVINTANTTSLNTTQASNNISIVAGTQITFANAGVYLVALNIQIFKSDAGNDEISVWLAQNGTNIANSNTEVSLSAASNSGFRSIAYLITAAAGDNIQVKWSSPDIAMQFLATAAQVTPTRPATPSVRIVVTQT